MDMHVPEIAIIDPNTLSSLGLRTLLEELIPTAIIRTFATFATFIDDTPDMYAHYFVSSQIYFEHTAFFRTRHPRAIVLTGYESNLQLAGVPTLNICQGEKELVKSILQLHQYGHPTHKNSKHAESEDAHELSLREIEVLRLIAKGLINKEIADRLHISLTTVISHRKNITEKLGIKSVPGLTIYAVMRGYIEADAI